MVNPGYVLLQWVATERSTTEISEIARHDWTWHHRFFTRKNSELLVIPAVALPEEYIFL